MLDFIIYLSTGWMEELRRVYAYVYLKTGAGIAFQSDKANFYGAGDLEAPELLAHASDR